MKAKPKLEQSIQEERIRAALNAHWHAPAVGDANAEHDIYDDMPFATIPRLWLHAVHRQTPDVVKGTE
jgi:hypothetical protein